MPRTYNVQDFDDEGSTCSDGSDLARLALGGMANQLREVGAVFYAGVADAIVTTGFYKQNAHEALPLFWCRTHYYDTECALVRLHWFPVQAPRGALADISSIGECELTCAREELTACLMVLVVEVARRALNRHTPPEIVEWYAESTLKTAIAFDSELFLDGQINPYVWTERARRIYEEQQGAER